MKMLPATPHRTALIRLLAPTPMMQGLLAWVVDTGMPRRLAPKRTSALLGSAAKPWKGLILMILVPIVLMMRFPPANVPDAMAMAQAAMTQRGMSLP